LVKPLLQILNPAKPVGTSGHRGSSK
jgi:hypothetical protein